MIRRGDISSTIKMDVVTSMVDLAGWQHDALWALIVGAILAFLMSMGLGANDVSNAFGTSVGSKVLTLFQAYVLATIFETLGSVLVGYNVTDTVRKSIINTDMYNSEPRTLLIGQVAILGGCAAWLIMATIMKWPVSSTQSIVGATIGMSVVMKGFNGISVSEVIKICSSWVISPILSGSISMILYIIVDHSVLRRKTPFKCGLKVLPIFYFCCLTFNTFAVVYQGSTIIGLKSVPLGLSFGIAFAVGGLTFVIMQFFVKPRLSKWIDKTTPDVTIGSVKTISTGPEFTNVSEVATLEKIDECVETRTQARDGTFKGFVKWFLPLKDRKTSPRVLKIFSSIQIFTACFAGFAHGANDVANSVAPLAALLSIYRMGNTLQSEETPIYVLLFGVLGICLGLWLFGHRVIETVGQRMTEINPASGFTIEFGAAVTALLASKAGLPISTTHCLVGSVVFVSAMKSEEAIDWSIFKGIVFSWIVTLPVSALFAGGLMRLLILFH
uniref:Phosphate transporter n=1 Tax=Rhabditophanes sp. KR3021 TaxID=114890 RepID=A0AC35UFI5_9BILA